MKAHIKKEKHFAFLIINFYLKYMLFMEVSVKKLFWDDPYLKNVRALIQNMDNNNVFFDQTIIYSFSGGQESDSGKINSIPTIDSSVVGNGIIQYTLASTENLHVGDEVEMEIDWDKRYKIMKLHSATHIALAVFYDIVGKVPVIGANVSSTKGRIDFLFETPITEYLPAIQNAINDVIVKNLDIITKKDESSNNPEGRLWVIEGLSQHWEIPCGGTHVKSTSEIEGIKLKRKNVGSGKERIEISLL
jgi:Ser-tRNA(Ala) deacylase AlaX